MKTEAAAGNGPAPAIHQSLPRPQSRLLHLARPRPDRRGGGGGRQPARRDRTPAPRGRLRGARAVQRPLRSARALGGAAGAAVGDVRAHFARRGPGGPGCLAAGRPLLLGVGRPLRPGGGGAGGGGRGRPGDPAPVPGAAAVGGPPSSVPAEQRAQQPRPALLRRAQPARAGAGRAEGADPLQEVRGSRVGWEAGPAWRGRGRRGSVGPPAIQPLSALPRYRGETSRGGWPGAARSGAAWRAGPTARCGAGGG